MGTYVYIHFHVCIYFVLGTVRRYLEHQEVSGGKGLETIVFVVDSCDSGIYEVLMPMYFPRSLNEERAAILQLPASIGGPNGEPLYPDRQIRIIDNPQHHHGKCYIHIFLYYFYYCYCLNIV